MTQTLDELIAEISGGKSPDLSTPSPRPEDAPDLEEMVASFSVGRAPKEAGLIGGIKEGYAQPARGEIYEQAREGDITLEEAERQIRQKGLRQKYTSPGLSWNPIKTAQTALFTAGNFIGQMVGTAKEVITDPTYLAEIGAGAGVGSVVPGVGTLAGAGYGVGLAMWDSIRNQTSGNLYAEMVNNGVDEKTADKAAFVGGALSALLEMAQFGTAGKLVSKGVGKLTQEAAEIAIAKAMTKKEVASNLAKIIGKQFVEAGTAEGAQEFSQQFIEEATKIFAEGVDGNVKDKTTWGDAFKSALQAFGETFLGGGLLGGVGGGIGTIQGSIRYDKEARNRLGFEKQGRQEDLGPLSLEEEIARARKADTVFQAQEGEGITDSTLGSIIEAEVDKGTANEISNAIFGKNKGALTEVEGATVLNILTTKPDKIEFAPLAYPDAQTIEAQRELDGSKNADVIKKASIVPSAVRSLAQIINNNDVNAGIRKDASALLGKIVNRKAKFSDTWLEEINSSLQKVTEIAQETTNSLALRKSLKRFKDDFIDGLSIKGASQYYSSLRDVYGKVSEIMPDWAKRYVGNLTNISTRLMSYLPVDTAREIFFDINNAELDKYTQKMKMVQPIKKDMARFATAEANTPVATFRIYDKNRDLEEINLSPNNISMLYLVSRMTDGKGNNRGPTGGITVLKNHGFNEDDITRIYKIMNRPDFADYKRSAEAIQAQMGEAWLPTATTFANITGRKLGKKTVMYPVNFLEQDTKAELKDDTGIGRFGVVEEIDPETGDVDNAFLRTSQDTNRRIANMSLYDSANRYFDDVSHYLSFAPLMYDFKRIFADKEFANEVKDQIGDKEYNALINELDAIRSGGTRYSKGQLDRFAHRIIGNMVRAVLAYPTVWVGQFSGVFSAAGMVDGGLQAIPRTVFNVMSHPFEAISEYKELVDNNPWFHNRAQMSQSDFERQLFKDERSAATLSTNKYMRRAQIGLKNVDRLAAKATTFADLFANFLGYKSIANALESRGIDAREAEQIANEALEKSQPTQSAISKAPLFRANSVWVEMLTRLKQQDNKSFNLILEAMHLFEEGYQVGPDGALMKDKKKISEAKQILMGQALNKLMWMGTTALTATMLSSALGTTDDPEEKLKKSLMMKAVQTMTGSLPGVDLIVEIFANAAQSRQHGLSVFMPTEPLVGAAAPIFDIPAGKGVSPSSVRDIGSILGLPRIATEPLAAAVTDKKSRSRRRTPRRRRRD